MPCDSEYCDRAVGGSVTGPQIVRMRPVGHVIQIMGATVSHSQSCVLQATCGGVAGLVLHVP